MKYALNVAALRSICGISSSFVGCCRKLSLHTRRECEAAKRRSGQASCFKAQEQIWRPGMRVTKDAVCSIYQTGRLSGFLDFLDMVESSQVSPITNARQCSS
jgi:hypothetical protein